MTCRNKAFECNAIYGKLPCNCFKIFPAFAYLAASFNVGTLLFIVVLSTKCRGISSFPLKLINRKQNTKQLIVTLFWSKLNQGLMVEHDIAQPTHLRYLHQNL